MDAGDWRLFNCLMSLSQNVSSVSKKTSLAWSTDRSYLAVGNDDGFVT